MNDKMVHDYLEGELNSVQQELLFAELNRSPQLRDELDYQMKLNRMMEMDRNASTTPTELTAALFNKLNYSIPMANNAKLVSSRRTYFWRYAVAMLLLLFVGIPAGVMVYDNYNDLSNSSNNSNSDQKSSIKNEFTNSNSMENNALVANIDVANNMNEGNNISENSALNQSSGNSNSTIKRVGNGRNGSSNGGNINDNNDRVIASNNSENHNNEAYLQNIMPTINSSVLEKNNSNYFSSNLTNIQNSSSSAIGININPIIGNIISLLSDENFEININIKNSINNFPPTTLNVTNNIYDNMAVSFWYNFDNGIDAGVELGRESFNQSFTTNAGLVYNQVPTLNYIGFGLRYSAYQFELPMETIPYLQFKASATTIGPIFNLQSGLTIASYSKVSVRFGVEYSSLIYNVNSNIYNSGKFNLIGGIVYSF